jgi:putative ABC transport system permease protein
VATLGAGLRASTEDAASQQVRARYVVMAKDRGGTFTTAVDVPGGSAVRTQQTDSGGNVGGYDPGTIARYYRFHALDGKLGGALVAKWYADDHHLKVGGMVRFDKVNARITGIYDPPALDPLLGTVAVPLAAFDRAYPQGKNAFVFTDARPSLGAFPDVKADTQAEFLKSRSGGLTMILSLLYVLLAFSVVVSLFGMVNTLVLAVYERTRELGMLRAIGMTRRQARRMIRHESVITALIGAAMGIPLGLFLAALVTEAVSKYGVVLAIPVPALAVFTAVAILAGIVAAIIPARRASRIDVLAALQYE